MKKWLVASMMVTALFTLPVVGGGANMLGHEVKAASHEDEMKTITVSGVGEVTVKPDVAYVQLGVQTSGKTALEAYQSNATTFAKIKAALAEQSIAEKDIQTVRFNAYPNYDYREGGRFLIGYEVNHIISVTHRELDSLGKFLDSLAEVGVNRIENIEYATEERNQYELQALEKAVANARQKAEVLAKAQGKTVQGAVHIQEGSGYSPPIFKTFAMEQAAAFDSPSASMEIYSGELTITKQVQVVFNFD